MKLPQARTEKLTIRELPEETLVYDLLRNKSHCLNPTATLVWQHCDGQTTIAEMAAILHAELDLPADQHVVRLALEQLSRRHLLKETVAPLSAKARITRRDALKKIAVAAAALPIVMTLTAKAARVNASGPSLICAECEGAQPSPIGGGKTCTPVSAGTKCSKGICDGQGKCVAQVTCGTEGQTCTPGSGGSTQGTCCVNCFCLQGGGSNVCSC